MQLRERIIPNSEMADGNSNFNSAVEASLLELEQLGMSCVLRNEKVKAISTPVLRQAKILLVQIRFFFWRVDYALEGSMFCPSKCDFSRLFHTERL